MRGAVCTRRGGAEGSGGGRPKNDSARPAPPAIPAQSAPKIRRRAPCPPPRLVMDAPAPGLRVQRPCHHPFGVEASRLWAPIMARRGRARRARGDSPLTRSGQGACAAAGVRHTSEVRRRPELLTERNSGFRGGVPDSSETRRAPPSGSPAARQGQRVESAASAAMRRASASSPARDKARTTCARVSGRRFAPSAASALSAPSEASA